MSCGWKMLPAISISKGCCGHQAFSHSSHPQWCALRGYRTEKSKMLALGSQGAYQRIDFNEPRLLPLPILRKMLNSLTWDAWFSLINSNLLMFWLPGVFFLQNSYILQKTHLQKIFCPPDKTLFSTFRLCIFFSVDASKRWKTGPSTETKSNLVLFVPFEATGDKSICHTAALPTSKACISLPLSPSCSRWPNSSNLPRVCSWSVGADGFALLGGQGEETSKGDDPSLGWARGWTWGQSSSEECKLRSETSESKLDFTAKTGSRRGWNRGGLCG